MQMLSGVRCGTGDAGVIRIVLLESDTDVKHRLQMIISDAASCVTVASADTWNQCERLLEEYAPELLVVGASQLPSGLSFEPLGFPVVVRLGDVSHADEHAVCHEYDKFRSLLFQTLCEIYLRKAHQLSVLLDCYLSGLDRSGYVSILKVCHAGEVVEIAVDQVDVVEASGNYVRVHASDKVYILRETISGIQSRLDPTKFVRVHRSYIANIDHISHLSPTNAAASILAMNNGQTIPIGPNYRAEIVRLLAPQNKLAA